MSESVFRKDILNDQVALVTGGGTGIGKEIARTLGEHGAKLAICSRKQEVIEATAKELHEEGLACLAIPCDVRKPDEVEHVVQGVLKHYGRLDIVINNAAGNFPAPIAGLSYNGFKAVVDIDLLGTYNVSKAAFDAWLGEHGGNIVNISAPYERQGPALQAHVAAAKMGVDSLTRTSAVEWWSKGIRVNGIAPGATAGTEGMARFAEVPRGEGAQKTQRRHGTTREMANCVLFLVSDASSYVSGQVFCVDGAATIDSLKIPL
jgi:peroxisomal 2,4-dienoyl-CoA reductase